MIVKNFIHSFILSFFIYLASKWVVKAVAMVEEIIIPAKGQNVQMP